MNNIDKEINIISNMAFNIDNVDLIKKEIGLYYRDKREELELTQNEVANKTDININIIKEMEKGNFDLECCLYFNMLYELGSIKQNKIYKLIKEKGCSEITNNPLVMTSMVLDIDILKVYKEIYLKINKIKLPQMEIKIQLQNYIDHTKIVQGGRKNIFHRIYPPYISCRKGKKSLC